jgi:hypothetical protein
MSTYNGDPDSDDHIVSIDLRDTANNYSMTCTWKGTGWYQEQSYWTRSNCAVHGYPDLDPFYNRFYMLAPITDKQLAARNVSSRRDVIVTQVWVCTQGKEWYP